MSNGTVVEGGLPPTDTWLDTPPCSPPGLISVVDQIVVTGPPGNIIGVDINDQTLWAITLVDGAQGDFRIDRYQGGALVDSPVTITRATGVVTFHDPVMLAADPTQPLGAATKQYVDARVAPLVADAPNDGTAYARKSAGWAHLTHSDITDWAATLAPYALKTDIPSLSTNPPLMNGTAAAGSSPLGSRYDHIHPTDTSLLPLTGGTLTGALTLAADPVANLQAATKHYVDAAITGELSNAPPLMNGTASPGTVTQVSRGDHVHPVDTSRYAASNPAGYQTAGQVTASLGAYLPLAGGTMTGKLIVAGPSSASDSTFEVHDGSGITLRQTASGYCAQTHVTDAGWKLDYYSKPDFTGPWTGFGFGPIIKGDIAQGMMLWAGSSSTGPVQIAVAANPFQILGQNAALSPRWAVNVVDAAPETGDDAGSNFTIQNYHDDGTAMGAIPFQIHRDSSETQVMVLDITNGPVAGGFAQMYCGWSGSFATPYFELDLFHSAAGGAGAPVGVFGITTQDAAHTVAYFCPWAAAGPNINYELGVYANNGGIPSFSGYVGLAQNATCKRWSMELGDGTPEGGANAGSNFNIQNFTDAGVLIGNPMSIVRSTGVVSFQHAIVNGPSDRTLKENIEPLEGALDKVEALQGVSFNFIGESERKIGLIAQDVAPVVPEILQSFMREGETKLGLDYSKLTALLIEAVKTLSARVAALEAAHG